MGGDQLPNERRLGIRHRAASIFQNRVHGP
jgi:hypothetical protein